MKKISELIKLYIERYDFFLKLTLEHLKISGISIIIATLIGGILGILISEYKKTSTLVLSITNFLYTIPSISLLGFLIPFSGIGNTTAIIALTIYALLPMIRNTYAGIDNIDKSIIESARGMGSTEFQILYKIKIPLATTVILAGFKNMVVMTIALAGIASFIGAGGLGVAVYRGITTNNQTMTIAGSLLIIIPVGCSKKSETLKIATKPMTEQFILGEMLKLIIEENTNLNVEITKGIGGGTSNIHPAILKGDFDMYPEYTGTGWSFILKETEIPDDETLYKQLQEKYNSEYDLTWVNLFGFNNTFGLVIRKDLAEKYNIKTYSDLAKYSEELTFGAEYDFYERDDGFDALCEEYNMNFKKSVDLDIGLKYNAINSKEIDVMNIFTTDGQLSNSDVVVLEDDKDFYQTYYCGTVVRNDTLEKYPELKEAIMKLDNIINEEEMAKLNYLVETEGQDESKVAKDFLIEKGLVK